MILEETALAGLVRVIPERLSDERGHFVRTYDAQLFTGAGMDGRIAQCSSSFNRRAGTLRGMHFQADPHAEAKLVRCTRGAIFDVALDLRPDSPTASRWHGEELSADNGVALFIPIGFAHGFQTLEDDTEVLYQISVDYVPAAARGVRWDSPRYAIDWPPAPPGGRTISERDAQLPDVAQ